MRKHRRIVSGWGSVQEAELHQGWAGSVLPHAGCSCALHPTVRPITGAGKEGAQHSTCLLQKQEQHTAKPPLQLVSNSLWYPAQKGSVPTAVLALHHGPTVLSQTPQRKQLCIGLGSKSLGGSKSQLQAFPNGPPAPN